MRRRTLLQAAPAVLTAPSLASAQSSARTLRFVPQGNLANIDPIWTTTVIARNHALMIYDTLFGLGRDFQPKPQMAASHEVSDDGLTHRIALRPDLRFHDGEKVTARDCIASIVALVEAGRTGPAAERAAAGDARHRRRSLRDRPEAALARPGLGARQALRQSLRHHAGAGGEDRPVPADHRLHGVRPLPLRRQGMGAGQHRGLRTPRRLCAARRAGGFPRRRQAGAFRPRRVAHHARPGHRRRGAAEQRDRLVGDAAGGPAARCCASTRTSRSRW